MAWVYIPRGSSGRHYYGSTTDLESRLKQHRRGHTATTKRLGNTLELVAAREFETLTGARLVERQLKRKKNPKVAIYFLSQ